MQIDIRKNSENLAGKLQDIQEQIAKFATRNDQIHNEQELEKIELEAQSLAKQLSDLLVAQKVQQNLDKNPALQDSAKELIHHVKKKEW